MTRLDTRMSQLSLDLDTAVTCVHLACAAYCDPGQIKNWTCKPCVASGVDDMRVIETFYAKKTDTNGYVGLDPANKRIIVAFMGKSEACCLLWQRRQTIVIDRQLVLGLPFFSSRLCRQPRYQAVDL